MTLSFTENDGLWAVWKCLLALEVFGWLILTCTDFWRLIIGVFFAREDIYSTTENQFLVHLLTSLLGKGAAEKLPRLLAPRREKKIKLTFRENDFDSSRGAVRKKSVSM